MCGLFEFSCCLVLVSLSISFMAFTYTESHKPIENDNITISKRTTRKMWAYHLKLTLHNSSPRLDKMVSILVDYISNAFSWMQMKEFGFKFHWKLIIYSQGSSIGSGNGLAPNRRQAIVWTNADLINWRIYTTLKGDELRRAILYHCRRGTEVASSGNQAVQKHQSQSSKETEIFSSKWRSQIAPIPPINLVRG